MGISKNELRLGNLVVLAHESNAPIAEVLELHKRYAVVRITPTQLENRPMYENIMPIKLTEDWLERLGFDKNLGGCYFDIPYMGYMNFENSILELGIASKFPIMGVATIIKHVHQLQNLYYVLTGKELTIKEPINE